MMMNHTFDDADDDIKQEFDQSITVCLLWFTISLTKPAIRTARTRQRNRETKRVYLYLVVSLVNCFPADTEIETYLCNGMHSKCWANIQSVRKFSFLTENVQYVLRTHPQFVLYYDGIWHTVLCALQQLSFCSFVFVQIVVLDV